MVLDTYDKDQDLLIFKNTYDDPNGGQPKKFKIKRTHPNAPEELFFVHIDVRNMNNLLSQESRRERKEAEMEAKKQQYSTQKIKPNQSKEQPVSSLEESAEPNRTSFCSICCCFSR